jgi:serine/threonine protein kinase
MSEHFEPPEFIGPYRVGGLITETPTAKIYESFHPTECSKLAIKCIRTSGPGCLSPQSIEDECSLLQSLSHPGIIQAKDTYEIDNFRCIVMDLAIGGDSFEYIHSNGLMPEGMACKVIHSVLSALAYLHDFGIWHRDIKPENLLLMDDSNIDPHVVIADLGFAKQFSRNEMCTEFIGTSFYMAPEIILKKPCTFRFES